MSTIGIDTVGVLTQYKPMVLNSYIGNGEAWDLDRSYGGVHVLPPYETEAGGSWYLGTADSIYHNIDFIDSYHPENVLILSGDHLYRMDYEKMLSLHKQKGADLTISVMEVAWEEASRFGIMETDSEGRIISFSEKPETPKSNLASMGIYVFSWPVLRQALLIDHESSSSTHDFGRDIIPYLLSSEKKLYAYSFSGYWRDVGTVESYYSANMDLLEDHPKLNLFGMTRIYSNSNIYPPHFIGPEAHVEKSIVSNGCRIYGNVYHSVLGSEVMVEKGATIKDSILLPGARVEAGATVCRAILAERSVIAAGNTFGSPSPDGEISLLGDDMKYQEVSS